MTSPIPFHQWKDKQIKLDSSESGIQTFRPKEWYWSAYGQYCNQIRSKEPHNDSPK